MEYLNLETRSPQATEKPILTFRNLSESALGADTFHASRFTHHVFTHHVFTHPAAAYFPASALDCFVWPRSSLARNGFGSSSNLALQSSQQKAINLPSWRTVFCGSTGLPDTGHTVLMAGLHLLGLIYVTRKDALAWQLSHHQENSSSGQED